MRSLLIASIVSSLLPAARAEGLDEVSAARFAQLALECVHKEYPNKIAHCMTSDADLKSPRELTPAFYGCYDWHSSVHGHWLLVADGAVPESGGRRQGAAGGGQSLTAPNGATEVTYVTAAGRETFERPYGMAWLLQLAAELRSATIGKRASGPSLAPSWRCGSAEAHDVAAEAELPDPHRRA